MPSTRRLPLITFAVLSALLVGCGDSGDDSASSAAPPADRAAITAVITELGEAARAGDTERVCTDLLTQNLATSIATAAGTSCAEEIASNIAGPQTSFSVSSVEIRDDTANAAVVDQQQRASDLLLERDGDGWRIARIG